MTEPVSDNDQLDLAFLAAIRGAIFSGSQGQRLADLLATLRPLITPELLGEVANGTAAKRLAEAIRANPPTVVALEWDDPTGLPRLRSSKADWPDWLIPFGRRGLDG